MKVNVHGLVFVGFAAAILAGAAHATGENIVTSKAYTDATYQAKSTGLSVGNTGGVWTAVDQEVTAEATSIPTTAAVKSYVDTALTNNGGTVYDGNLSITVNNTTGTFTANQSGDTTFSITGLEETTNKLDGTSGNAISDTTSSNEATKYPSAKAVKDYVASELSNTSNVGNGTLTISVNGTANGTTFTANQAGNSTIALTNIEVTTDKVTGAANDGIGDVAQADEGTKYPSVKAVKDYVAANAAPTSAEQNVQANWNETDTTSDAYIQNKPTALSQFTDDLGDQKTANLSSSISTDTGSTTKYPSVAAVEAAIAAQHTADNGVYQAKSTALSVGNGDGGWTAAASSVTNDANTVPTTAAVYNAIQAQPASKIPDQNTDVCTSTQPCALVAGATSFHWITMATGNHQGGVCGDAGTNQTCENLGTAPNA